ncbi:MAG: hypothetical protein AB1791_08685 [Chloroflexota bacterium]
MALSTTQAQELTELRSRVDWLDEERRKFAKKQAELDQKVALQERELEGREQRIQELERQVANLTGQLARFPQVDARLQQFKDEIIQLVEQYDQRRLQAQTEMERLRRVEREVQAREIAEVRKELPAVGRLQEEMQQRQAEEARLAHLIGVVQGKIPALESRVETWPRDVAYLAEAEKLNSQNIGALQTSILEISKRWEPIHVRLDALGNSFSKAEGRIQELSKAQIDAHQVLRSYAEQVQLGEYERNKRLEGWKALLDDFQERMKRFAQETATFAELYKQAKTALQTLPEWQKRIEGQQRDAAELARVEAGRLQARWESFSLDNDKRWKTLEVETEQRWASAQREDKRVEERFLALEEQISAIQQDKELLWRVQTAQADALKQFPRIWLEEVEKAVAQNPNRRRQPALVPTPGDEG